jgi:hypothetical protein
MKKKIKDAVRADREDRVDSCPERTTTVGIRDTPLPIHMPDQEYIRLERLVILLRRRQSNGPMLSLGMDVASSLMHPSDSSARLHAVSYKRLANMFADAGVNCETEWIWAAHIETDPIRGDGALRAALGSAIQSGLDRVVFTSFAHAGMDVLCKLKS